METASISMPLGIVVRKSPGVTRWAGWVWRVVGVLPAARNETWKELRREGEAVEYHAATVDLELHRTEAEAYVAELSTQSPSVYVIMREGEDPGTVEDIEIVLATVSPFEAQDYADTGEELVEPVPMPPALRAWVQDFVETHHSEKKFIKRRRDKKRVDLVEEGVGDPRISQPSDVYRAPGRKRGVVQ
ncbi:MAG: DUF3305 domain-containing protein [Paracoccaceae bacterium]|nr:DUF3305 domain-containing protein [Paracoccaceae bacterium]